MASSKPKKGFSMSLGKPKMLPSSSSAANKGGDRVASGNSSSSSSKLASAIGVSHDEDDDGDAAAGGGKRDYVTGIGGGKVVTKELVVERGPRVISLVSNPWAKGSSSSSSSNGTAAATTATSAAVPPPTLATPAARPAHEQPAAEKSLDQLAAEAIALESRRGDGRGDGGAANGYGLGLESDRVIGMLGGKAGETEGAATTVTTADTGGGGGGGGSTGSRKKTGLLEQNMIPGIMDVDGEDAKFKHDLGHRAEDLSARSKAYVDVPVAEFGAALLRGMGWTGPEGNGGGGGGAGAAGSALPADIEPRHHRLGLGAQPKPPEEMKRPRKRKPGEKPRASDAQRLKIWEQKVQEERAKEASRPAAAAKLSVMDVVELSGEAGGEGRRRPRAMVLKTQGVPGLNKISVRLEDTGEKVIVDKSSATRVSEDDLARRPFSEKKNGSSKNKRGDSQAADAESGTGGRNGARNGGGMKRGRSRSQSRSISSGSSGGGDSVERDAHGGRGARDGGEKKSKTSSKKEKKKKHKKSVSSKREREQGRSNSGERRSSSPPDRHRRYGDERGDRDTGRRRQADRGGEDERMGRRGEGRKGKTPPDDDADRKRRRRDTAGDRDGGTSFTSGSGRSNKNDNDRRHRSDSREPQPTPAPEPPAGAWLRANIRVRVVHKSYAGGRAYLGKGRVVDVPRIGQATVRMDLGDLVLEGVKERHLETVLPARGGKVIVVRGREKGATGKLLAKNKEKETALLQVYEDLRAITLSLDDVAEFTGMLDEDMDDVGY